MLGYKVLNLFDFPKLNFCRHHEFQLSFFSLKFFVENVNNNINHSSAVYKLLNLYKYSR